jgi:hypothetical protein
MGFCCGLVKKTSNLIQQLRHKKVLKTTENPDHFQGGLFNNNFCDIKKSRTGKWFTCTAFLILW